MFYVLWRFIGCPRNCQMSRSQFMGRLLDVQIEIYWRSLWDISWVYLFTVFMDMLMIYLDCNKGYFIFWISSGTIPKSPYDTFLYAPFIEWYYLNLWTIIHKVTKVWLKMNLGITKINEPRSNCTASDRKWNHRESSGIHLLVLCHETRQGKLNRGNIKESLWKIAVSLKRTTTINLKRKIV